MASTIKVPKKPSEMFQDLVAILRFASGIVGGDVLDPMFRINWRIKFTILVIVFYFIFTTTTISKLFASDWKILLEALCMMSSVLQGITKTIAILGNKQLLRTQHEQLKEMYFKYEVMSPEHVKILSDSLARFKKIFIAIGASFIIAVVVLFVIPIVLALMGDPKRYLIMHFHLPGIDVDTSMGYMFTQMTHASCIFVGAFGLYAGDLYVLLYITQAFVIVELFKIKVADLNRIIANPDNRSSPHVHAALIDIVQWHQHSINYNQLCNNLFYYVVTVQITTSGLSIAFTIFILLASSWHGAIPYLVMTIYNLYVYCILGTKIEICNESFEYAIYNIYWYNMCIPHQKVVRLMLMKAQSPITIDVAGFMPLSVTTALQISKTIYSFTMMLVRFV